MRLFLRFGDLNNSDQLLSKYKSFERPKITSSTFTAFKVIIDSTDPVKWSVKKSTEQKEAVNDNNQWRAVNLCLRVLIWIGVGPLHPARWALITERGHDDKCNQPILLKRGNNDGRDGPGRLDNRAGTVQKLHFHRQTRRAEGNRADWKRTLNGIRYATRKQCGPPLIDWYRLLFLKGLSLITDTLSLLENWLLQKKNI